MKIAIMSDVHDQRDNLTRCLDSIKKNGCDQIIHLGDYWAPWLCVKPLVECWIPVFGIWWNNDWEKRRITQFFEWSKWCEIAWTVYAEREFDWKKFFMVHYHDIYETIARSWDFDVVFYGHNHLKNELMIWDTLVINPWALAGNKEAPSYAIYDTTTHTVEFIEL